MASKGGCLENSNFYLKAWRKMEGKHLCQCFCVFLLIWTRKAVLRDQLRLFCWCHFCFVSKTPFLLHVIDPKPLFEISFLPSHFCVFNLLVWSQ